MIEGRSEVGEDFGETQSEGGVEEERGARELMGQVLHKEGLGA